MLKVKLCSAISFWNQSEWNDYVLKVCTTVLPVVFNTFLPTQTSILMYSRQRRPQRGCSVCSLTYVYCKWRAGENPIQMSYLESHSLSNQIRNWLQGLIVPFMICNLLISKIGNVCMFFIYVNSQLNCKSRGEGWELPPTSAWWQFPALLSAPVVEPKSSLTQ